MQASNVPEVGSINTPQTGSDPILPKEAPETPLLTPSSVDQFPESDQDQTPVRTAREERDETICNLKWGCKQLFLNVATGAFGSVVDAGGAFMWQISDSYLVGHLSQDSFLRWITTGSFQMVGTTTVKAIPTACYNMWKGEKFRDAVKGSIKKAEIVTSLVSGTLWLPFRNLGEIINNNWVSGSAYSLGKTAVRTATIIGGIGATLFASKKVENKLAGREESNLKILAEIAPVAIAAGGFNVQGDTEQFGSPEGDREAFRASIYVFGSNAGTSLGIGGAGLFKRECCSKKSETEVVPSEAPSPV